MKASRKTSKEGGTRGGSQNSTLYLSGNHQEEQSKSIPCLTYHLCREEEDDDTVKPRHPAHIRPRHREPEDRSSQLRAAVERPTGVGVGSSRRQASGADATAQS